jgi:hypothetical protein
MLKSPNRNEIQGERISYWKFEIETQKGLQNKRCEAENRDDVNYEHVALAINIWSTYSKVIMVKWWHYLRGYLIIIRLLFFLKIHGFFTFIFYL